VGGNRRRQANAGGFRHAEADRGKQPQGNRIAGAFKQAYKEGRKAETCG
jgi:hypothetical protein